MLKIKLLFLIITFSFCIPSARAMEEKKPQDDSRDSSTGVVKVLPKANTSPLDKLLEERKEVLSPTATSATLDHYFSGQPCRLQEGPIATVVELYNTPNANLTVTKQAQEQLPPNHVLAVHVFKTTKTEEGQSAITTQYANAFSTEGCPISYRGVVKHLEERNDTLRNITAVFDLTGATDPQISIIETFARDSVAQKDFQEELKRLETGIKYVSIHAPEATIPVVTLHDGQEGTVSGYCHRVNLSSNPNTRPVNEH